MSTEKQEQKRLEDNIYYLRLLEELNKENPNVELIKYLDNKVGEEQIKLKKSKNNGLFNVDTTYNVKAAYFVECDNDIKRFKIEDFNGNMYCIEVNAKITNKKYK